MERGCTSNDSMNQFGFPPDLRRRPLKSSGEVAMTTTCGKEQKTVENAVCRLPCQQGWVVLEGDCLI